MLQTLSSFEKYKTNIDDVGLKRRNPEPKKWSLFNIVGTYSSGVKMALKYELHQWRLLKSLNKKIADKVVSTSAFLVFFVAFPYRGVYFQWHSHCAPHVVLGKVFD